MCTRICCGHENDEVLERGIMLLDDGDTDKGIMSMDDKWEWEELEAVIDSGSVDHVVNPRRLVGHKVVPTEEAKNGGHWKGAGGQEIPKLGKVWVFV